MSKARRLAEERLQEHKSNKPARQVGFAEAAPAEASPRKIGRRKTVVETMYDPNGEVVSREMFHVNGGIDMSQLEWYAESGLSDLSGLFSSRHGLFGHTGQAQQRFGDFGHNAFEFGAEYRPIHEVHGFNDSRGEQERQRDEQKFEAENQRREHVKSLRKQAEQEAWQQEQSRIAEEREQLLQQKQREAANQVRAAVLLHLYCCIWTTAYGLLYLEFARK